MPSADSLRLTSPAKRNRRQPRGITLRNSLDWPRGGVVRLADPRLPRREFELIDTRTGAAVLYERHADAGIEFLAPPVPARGQLVLEVRPVQRRTLGGATAQWDGRKLTLHTSDYSLQFHEAGGLARWHDRAHSTQWCSDTVDFPMGTYLCKPAPRQRSDRPRLLGGGPATVSAEITPVCSRVRIQAACPMLDELQACSRNAARYCTTFTLYHGSLDLHVNMKLPRRRPPTAEAGYAFFPFSGTDPKILIDHSAPAWEAIIGGEPGELQLLRGIRVQQRHTGINFYPLQILRIGFGKPDATHFDRRAKHANGIMYATLFDRRRPAHLASRSLTSFDFVLRPCGNQRSRKRKSEVPRWVPRPFNRAVSDEDCRDSGLARGAAEFAEPLVATIL